MVRVSLSNCMGRDGYRYYYDKDFEVARKDAIEYVRQCSHRGVTGFASINFYNDDNILEKNITISSVVTGEYDTHGYAIPVMSDDFDEVVNE